MIGTISENGVLCEGKIYKYGWGKHTNRHGEIQTLFANSSFARQTIVEFVGRRCSFRINLLNEAYNIGLIDEKDNVISL